MGRLAWAVLAIWPGMALAHGWERLDGVSITQALAGHGVVFDGTQQRFDRDGTTVLELSPPRHGRWRVQGDRYCTVIPPLTSWTCYTVEGVHGEMIRFVGPDGSAAVEGFLVP